MRPIRIIGYIIELIIAIAIFIVLAQKTPLFDRVMPGWSSNFSSTQSTTTPSISNTTSTSGSTINSGTTKTSMSNEPIRMLVYNTEKSCITPRGQTITHQQSVVAYSKKVSDTSNMCLSEIRTCRQGKLSGSYPYKVCDFFIDGKRNGKEVIVGANNSQQQFGTEAIQLQSRFKSNKDYIQPKPFQNRTQLAYVDTQGHLMSNSSISINNRDTIDILDQETIRHDHNQEATGSCITPRGETVTHGTVTYAYDINNSTTNRSCKVEARTCINGKLSGTYQYKNCDIGISQKEKTSDTLQSLAWTENDRLGKQTRIFVNNGSISPGGPIAPRPLHDQINDKVSLSQYRILSGNGTSNSNGGKSQNTVQNNGKTEETYTTNYYPVNNNTQDTIKLSDCTSPWGTVVQHEEYITAYRNQSVEHNSLCDSEKRFCRNGVLGGSYTYSSCNTSNQVKSQGQGLNTTINNAQKRVKKAAQNTDKRVSNAIKNTRNRIKNIF